MKAKPRKNKAVRVETGKTSAANEALERDLVRLKDLRRDVDLVALRDRELALAFVAAAGDLEVDAGVVEAAGEDHDAGVRRVARRHRRADEIAQYIVLSGHKEYDPEFAAREFMNLPGPKLTVVGPDGKTPMRVTEEEAVNQGFVPYSPAYAKQMAAEQTKAEAKTNLSYPISANVFTRSPSP